MLFGALSLALDPNVCIMLWVENTLIRSVCVPQDLTGEKQRGQFNITLSEHTYKLTDQKLLFLTDNNKTGFATNRDTIM